MYDGRQRAKLDRLARRWQRGSGDSDRIFAEVRDIVRRTPGKYTYQEHLCRVSTAGRSYEHIDDVRSVMDEAIWRALQRWDPAKSPFWAYVDMRVEMAARKYWWGRGLADDMPVHVSGAIWGRYLREIVARGAGQEYDEEFVAEIEAWRYGASLDAGQADDACLMDLLRDDTDVASLVEMLHELWGEARGLTDDDEEVLLLLLADASYDEVAAMRGDGTTGEDVRERWLIILGALADVIGRRRRKAS